MRKRRFLSTASAAVLASAMMFTAMPVFAANSYTAISGGTTNFDKYLVMDKEANVPNVSFTYTIEAGSAIPADVTGNKFAVLAGVDAGNITITDQDDTTDGYQLVFSSADTTSADANSNVKNYNAATQKYATKTATVDFSGCSFTEPGIYRYKITESGTNQGVTNDADPDRYLDVYVEDDNGSLKIQGYVLHANASNVTIGTDNQLSNEGENNDAKSQGFTNTYGTADLTISKTVTGNQGSRDKYFKFTVVISGAVAGTKYTVDLTDAESAPVKNGATIYDTMTNPGSIEIPAGATTVTTEFYLKSGQSIVIRGLAEETKFSVTEEEEDYKPSVQVDSAAAVDSETTGEKTIESADITVAYTNIRSGVIPTGVIMTVTPFAAITLLGGFGAVKIIMKKRREDEE